MEGFALLGSLFGIMALLIPTGLILGLFVVFALRGDPDEAGGRGITLYLGMASFVGFLALLFSVTALAASITDLATSDDPDSGWSNYPPNAEPDEFDFDSDESFDGGTGFDDGGLQVPSTPLRASTSFGRDDDDKAWTSIIQSLIALAAALLVLRFHWPRLEAVRQRAAAGSAPARMHQSYAYVVCFIVVVTLLVSASVAAFSVVQAIAPGTTGVANRGDALESFVPLAVLALGAAVLFRVHWARVPTPAFLLPPPPPPPPATE